MFATQEIIRRGAHIRIGNGDVTIVAIDPWLPCNFSGMILFTLPLTVQFASLSFLLLGN